jgi:DNA polymerase (family 10)
MGTHREPDARHLFGQLPGIGDKLARRILKDLGVRTLEQLELAAHDGRLKRVKGFGAERVRRVKEALAGRLSRQNGSRPFGRRDSAAAPRGRGAGTAK